MDAQERRHLRRVGDIVLLSFPEAAKSDGLRPVFRTSPTSCPPTSMLTLSHVHMHHIHTQTKSMYNVRSASALEGDEKKPLQLISNRPQIITLCL